MAVPSGEGLADHAELLVKVDAREFVGDIKVPMLILAPTNSRMAPLDGQDSQRELQAKVKGSRIVPIDGVGHEIYVFGISSDSKSMKCSHRTDTCVGCIS